MSGEAIARGALFYRALRINPNSEVHVTDKVSLSTENYCHELVQQLHSAKREKGPRGVAMVVRERTKQEGWNTRSTVHFEPVGENGMFGIRLKDPGCIEKLKTILGPKIARMGKARARKEESVFETYTTEEGDTSYLMILATVDSQGGNKLALSWASHFLSEAFMQLPEFEGCCSQGGAGPKFKVMEDWVRAQLGPEMVEECVEMIEEISHTNGAYVKRQYPQLRLADGRKNPHFGFLKGSIAKTWTVGARIEMPTGAWSPVKVLFSCTPDGTPCSVPPYHVDNAAVSWKAWAEMTGHLPQGAEEAYKQCFDRALGDAHFCEYIPTPELEDAMMKEAYLDSHSFNQSLQVRLKHKEHDVAHLEFGPADDLAAPAPEPPKLSRELTDEARYFPIQSLQRTPPQLSVVQPSAAQSTDISPPLQAVVVPSPASPATLPLTVLFTSEPQNMMNRVLETSLSDEPQNSPIQNLQRNPDQTRAVQGADDAPPLTPMPASPAMAASIGENTFQSSGPIIWVPSPVAQCAPVTPMVPPWQPQQQWGPQSACFDQSGWQQANQWGPPIQPEWQSNQTGWWQFNQTGWQSNQTEWQHTPPQQRQHSPTPLRSRAPKDHKLDRKEEQLNRLAKFECTDALSKKGQLGEKGRGLWVVVERLRPTDCSEALQMFSWLLEDDNDGRSNIVYYAKQQGWHNFVQKAIVFASKSQLKEITQTFKRAVQGVSGDTYGSLVLQQLLDVAQEDANSLQPNEAGGLARTILDIFKPYFVDQKGIIDSSRGADSSDRAGQQVSRSSNFVVQKWLVLLMSLPEEDETFQQVLKILVANAVTSDVNGKTMKGIACSQTGCRVYQRILETSHSGLRAQFVDGFVQKLLEPDTFEALVKDAWGNYVMQHILKEPCRPVNEKLRILDLLAGTTGRMCYYATHEFARHVLQRSFEDSALEQISGSQDRAAWRSSQRAFLEQVFRLNGHLMPGMHALQQPKAQHALTAMKNTFKGDGSNQFQ